MSRTLFLLLQISRRIWVRTVLISALAFLAAVLSPILSPLLPVRLASEIGADALRRLLDILSTSMLAVTTFSLTVIAATHLTAARHVTPRVHRMLREDGAMQTTLATFMGAFVYALVSIVMLNLRIHGEEDFGTVYLFTLLVIALVIVAILRWIQRLTTLGALDSTTAEVASRTRDAIESRRKKPWFGGRPVPDGEAPQGSRPLPAPGFGYVQHIDIEALEKAQRRDGGTLRLAAQPGDWVDAGAPLAHVSGGMAAQPAALCSAFVLGETRTHAHDPGYGLRVLSEIASRALSQSTNDPQTAIDVLIRILQLLALPPAEQPAPDHAWLEVPRRDPGDLVRLALDPIARDGRAFVEVAARVQKVAAVLARHPDPAVAEAARDVSRRALAYAEPVLLPEDISLLLALAPPRA